MGRWSEQSGQPGGGYGEHEHHCDHRHECPHRQGREEDAHPASRENRGAGGAQEGGDQAEQDAGDGVDGALEDRGDHECGAPGADDAHQRALLPPGGAHHGDIGDAARTRDDEDGHGDGQEPGDAASGAGGLGGPDVE